MSQTVGDLAARLDVTAQTVRTWAAEFGEWLSPTATPGAGKTRIFTAGDLEVMGYVAQRRAAHTGYEEIKDELARGARLQVPPGEGEPRASQPTEPPAALALAYEQQLAYQRGQLDLLSQEHERTRNELASARNALQDATERAIRAETLLEQYRTAETPPEPPEPAQGPTIVEDPDAGKPRRRWWQVWRR